MTNPQKCVTKENLTEVIARSSDTIETLKEKVRLATILGCLQSTLTNFKNLRPEWKQKCEEERLLGVSITGVFDCPLLYELATLDTVLGSLKQVAIDTAKEWSERLDIKMPMAITCIKPSGTVSLLCDTASGLHARHNPYYIRTVRGDNKDPLTKLMKASDVVNEPCLSKPESTTIFSFAMKSPEGAICRNDLTALHQLEIWKAYQLHWCEHKPSVTVSVAEDEWVEVGAWIWKNFDILSGISFLPRSEHSYQQAPLQDCSKEDYVNFFNADIHWEQLSDFELEDSTTSAREYACVSGACDIV
jgi:ribonucleoside-diphosphate reductase alpha chain